MRFPSTVASVTIGAVAVPKSKVAEVTEESLDGWKAFALRHGMTPTSFAEALGRMLASVDTPLDELPPLLRDIVLEARQIAADSRGRAGRKQGER